MLVCGINNNNMNNNNNNHNKNNKSKIPSITDPILTKFLMEGFWAKTTPSSLSPTTSTTTKQKQQQQHNFHEL